MGNFLTFNFWFDYYFTPLTPWCFNIFVAAVAIFIVATIVFLILKLKAQTKKKLWSEIFDFSLGNAVIGLILLLVYYEEVNFFSARIWFAFWFIEIIFWAWHLVKYGKTFFAKRDDAKAQDTFKKYLPK
ncbi:MAG: hypothetical protein WCK37_04190 [Candidatus Falkowbacteria bacterium]